MASGGVVDWLHQAERKKEAEENKENVRLDQCFSDASGLPNDQDDWNDSVISGGSFLKGKIAYNDIHQINNILIISPFPSDIYIYSHNSKIDFHFQTF